MQIVIRCDCASFGQRGLKTCKSLKTKLCHLFKVKKASHKRLQGAKSTVKKYLIIIIVDADNDQTDKNGMVDQIASYIQNDNLSQN